MILENEVEGLIGSLAKGPDNINFDKTFPTLPLMKLGALERISFFLGRKSNKYPDLFVFSGHGGGTVYTANGEISFKGMCQYRFC